MPKGLLITTNDQYNAYCSDTYIRLTIKYPRKLGKLLSIDSTLLKYLLNLGKITTLDSIGNISKKCLEAREIIDSGLNCRRNKMEIGHHNLPSKLTTLIFHPNWPLLAAVTYLVKAMC